MPALKRIIATGACVLGLLRPVHTQQPAAPAAAPDALPASRLSGSWQVDRQQFPDDQDVWKRRVDALAATTTPTLHAPIVDPLLAASPVNMTNGLDIAQLRTAMRDLLETAERLRFDFDKDAVTITDDLNRARTYATTGKKEKRQLAATEFDAKTRWTGPALTQDIAVWSLAMTEVYLAKDDGQGLLVSIKVLKPAFQPPLKDIVRVYTRQTPK